MADPGTPFDNAPISATPATRKTSFKYDLSLQNPPLGPVHGSGRIIIMYDSPEDKTLISDIPCLAIMNWCSWKASFVCYPESEDDSFSGFKYRTSNEPFFGELAYFRGKIVDPRIESGLGVDENGNGDLSLVVQLKGEIAGPVRVFRFVAKRVGG